MKKRIVSILLAVIMVATLICGAIPTMAADRGDIIIRIHYHREDGDYTNWQLWAWDFDGKGNIYGTGLDGSPTDSAAYAYEEGEDEVIFTIGAKSGTMRIGYIVRKGEWEAKDVEFDQHINITGILSGTVDFYVESGVPSQTSGDISTMPSVDDLVEKGFMVKGDDVKEGIMVTNASYKTANRDGKPEMTVTVSSGLSYEADLNTFKVFNSDGEVGIESMRLAGTNYYLVLSEELNLSRGYSISFEGSNYDVTMPDYYSTEEFVSQYIYEGDDLGMTYTKESTKLRVWSPLALSVSVNLYNKGSRAEEENPFKTVEMTPDVNGTWVTTLEGDMNGIYYTYVVTTDTETNEACDPYARTTGVNGNRAMIIDLDATDPEGWEDDVNPNADLRYVDSVIYELHVRDASIHESSGVKDELKGKFLGLIESGTKTSGGVSTVLDHMIDLGVTHVHLLPSYDFATVQEDKLDDDTVSHFNWGYDPQNYNVPEGSYSTDPYNGEVRVSEFKQMVQGLHNAGISVIMDVVYNHVYDSNKFCFNQIVDGYFSRPGSNGSGCGNDTASERAMVKKYIVDSVNYWVDEYHVDGFRFDLVGLIDVDTINEIVETVHAKRPDVIFYGEGWTMSTVLTTSATLATQTNSTKTPSFAYFSDTIRNALKGGTYGGVSKGFISGAASNTAELFACFKGMPSWCSTPSQSINYISCHDNNTLYDHITMVTSDATAEQRVAMNKLGAAFYMTAQGIPFFQAGEEFLRSKPDGKGGYDENSYSSGDGVNALIWSDLENAAYKDVYDYYKGLIAFRKEHAALRMDDALDVNSNVSQLSGLAANVVGYEIKADAVEDNNIVAVFNANREATSVTLPAGEWTVYVNALDAGTTALANVSGTVSVDALSALVLVQDGVIAGTNSGNSTNTGNTGSDVEEIDNTGIIIGIIVGVVAAIALLVVGLLKKKK